MAKSRKSNSKRELEKVEKELINEINEEKEEVITDVTWDTIEEFSEAVTSSGMIYNSDFIPVNIEALYTAYTSNLKEFKKTPAYKFLIQ